MSFELVRVMPALRAMTALVTPGARSSIAAARTGSGYPLGPRAARVSDLLEVDVQDGVRVPGVDVPVVLRVEGERLAVEVGHEVAATAREAAARDPRVEADVRLVGRGGAHGHVLAAVLDPVVHLAVVRVLLEGQGVLGIRGEDGPAVAVLPEPADLHSVGRELHLELADGGAERGLGAHGVGEGGGGIDLDGVLAHGRILSIDG